MIIFMAHKIITRPIIRGLYKRASAYIFREQFGFVVFFQQFSKISMLCSRKVGGEEKLKKKSTVVVFQHKHIYAYYSALFPRFVDCSQLNYAFYMRLCNTRFGVEHENEPFFQVSFFPSV